MWHDVTSDYCLLTQMKEELSGRHFDHDDGDVIAAVSQFVEVQDANP